MSSVVQSSERPEVPPKLPETARELKLCLCAILSSEGESSAALLWELGAKLHAKNEPEAALIAFEHAAIIEPSRVQTWHALTVLRLQLALPRMALDAASKAYAIMPSDIVSRFNLAVAHEAAGNDEDAVTLYRSMLDEYPDHAGAHLNLGTALHRLDRQTEGILAQRRAVEALPGHSGILRNLAGGELAAGYFDAAVAAYASLLENPEAIPADGISLALAMACAGNVGGANLAMQSVLVRWPNALEGYVSPLRSDIGKSLKSIDLAKVAVIGVHARLRAVDWHRYEEDLDTVFRVAAGAGPEMTSSAQELMHLSFPFPLSVAACAGLATRIAEKVSADIKDVRLVRAQRPYSHQRLRIGYISGDFRANAVSRLVTDVFAMHDAVQFEIFAYSTGPDDASPDRQRIAQVVEHFIDVSRFDSEAIAQRIIMDGVDVLIDLSGYTLYNATNTLALRPAPLQLSYIGFLETQGAPWIDYVILDDYLVTEAVRSCWRERIISLPASVFPFVDTEEVAELRSRDDYGLPEDAFILASFNAPWKLSPMLFDLWAEIVCGIDDSVLWIYVESQRAAENLRNELGRRGVPENHIVTTGVLPRAAHLARYPMVDLCLDTLVCNGHSTTAEALTMGVPVLTLPGERVVSRISAALLHALGLEEFIAASPEDYVNKARALAENYGVLERAKERLQDPDVRARCSASRVAKYIERAILAAWERHCSGQSPCSFDVPAS